MRLSGSKLECVRGGKRVFANIGCELGAGEALLLLGRSGAGKSSLLRMVAGLLRPAAESFELAGADSDRSLAEQAHYLGHLDPLKSSLSVGENLRFWTRFLGGGRGSEPLEALRAVGLERVGDLPAGYLSAGQRRRLSLARLLAAPRAIWLLLEPARAPAADAQAPPLGVMRPRLAAAGRNPPPT